MSETNRVWWVDALTPAVDFSGAERGGEMEPYALAGLGARVAAFLTDLAIQLPGLAAIFFGAVLWIPGSRRPLWLGVLVLALHLIAALYFVVFETATRGQTPGKSIWRLRAVSCTGQIARSGQLILRNLMRVIDSLPFGGAVGFLIAAFSRNEQRLGDLVARTVVIYDIPIRELLARAQVPPSVFSTSEDEYLLEGFLTRQSQLRPDIIPPIARQLAGYFHGKYPTDDVRLNNTYNDGRYLEFLDEFYHAEKQENPRG